MEISKETENNEYNNTIYQEYVNVKNSLEKITSIMDMNAYVVSDEKLNGKELKVFHLNSENAVKEAEKLEKIHLHKIAIEEGMNLIYYSNIIYYDNLNNTLPLGMNISDKILIDLEMYDIRIKKQKIYRINQDLNEIENKTKILCIYEYELKLK